MFDQHQLTGHQRRDSNLPVLATRRLGLLCLNMKSMLEATVMKQKISLMSNCICKGLPGGVIKKKPNGIQLKLIYDDY